ncbi:MAG: hypothetical protein Kow0069_10160 [Promethearchaeota archaeon]
MFVMETFTREELKFKSVGQVAEIDLLDGLDESRDLGVALMWACVSRTSKFPAFPECWSA